MRTISYEGTSKTASSKGAKKKHAAVPAKKNSKHTVVKKPVHSKAVVKQATVVEDESAVPSLAPARSSETAATTTADAVVATVPASSPNAAGGSTQSSTATVTAPKAATTPAKVEVLHTEAAKIVTPKPPVIKPLPRTVKMSLPSVVKAAPTTDPIEVAGPAVVPATVGGKSAALVGATPVAAAAVVAAAPTSVARPSAAPLAKSVTGPRLSAVVYSLVPADGAIYAGTSVGLMQGDAEGRVWQPVKGLPIESARYIAAQGAMIFVASLKSLSLSSDGGRTWALVPSPPELTQIAAVAVDELNTLWVGGRQGLYYSIDSGATWKQLQNMYMQQVDGVYFDQKLDRILVTTAESPILFVAQLPDYRVSYWDTGWKLRFARPVGNHLLGATLYDGMVVQPEMVDSAVGKTALTGGK
jgi:hypothetical protein